MWCGDTYSKTGIDPSSSISLPTYVIISEKSFKLYFLNPLRALTPESEENNRGKSHQNDNIFVKIYTGKLMEILPGARNISYVSIANRGWIDAG